MRIILNILKIHKYNTFNKNTEWFAYYARIIRRIANKALNTNCLHIFMKTNFHARTWIFRWQLSLSLSWWPYLYSKQFGDLVQVNYCAGFRSAVTDSDGWPSKYSKFFVEVRFWTLSIYWWEYMHVTDTTFSRCWRYLRKLPGEKKGSYRKLKKLKSNYLNFISTFAQSFYKNKNSVIPLSRETVM